MRNKQQTDTKLTLTGAKFEKHHYNIFREGRSQGCTNVGLGK